MKSLKALLPVLYGLLILNSAFAQSETRLLRFPAIFGDRLVFSYAAICTPSLQRAAAGNDRRYWL